MSVDELSPYLKRVLSVFDQHLHGIFVDLDTGQPDPDGVRALAALLEDTEEDTRNALLGLRASDCLVEQDVVFAGIEGLLRWAVHPQCREPRR